MALKLKRAIILALLRYGDRYLIYTSHFKSSKFSYLLFQTPFKTPLRPPAMSPTSPGVSKQEQLVLIFQGPIYALDQGEILLGTYLFGCSTAAQRTKITEKVHKPSLGL